MFIAVDGQVMPQVLREDPQIVQPEQMVGVLVRIEDRVNQADVLAEQLRSQVGGRVDEQIALGQSEDDAASRSPVLQIGVPAGFAAAPDDRDAVRRARAEKNELIVKVATDGRHSEGSGFLQIRRTAKSGSGSFFG